MEEIDCAGALIIRDKRIFLTKRSKSKRSYPDCWDAVGGDIKPGESPEQAIVREVKEETGTEFKISQFMGVFKVKEPTFTLNVYRYMGNIKGKIKLNGEASDYGWFSYDQCKKLKFGFNYLETVEWLHKIDLI